jgi:chromosome segregation ATPase
MDSDWRINRRRRDTVVTNKEIHELDEEARQLLLAMGEELGQLRARLAEIEARPQLVASNDGDAIPRGITELYNKIEQIEHENKQLNEASRELSVSALRTFAEFSDSLEECRKQIAAMDAIWARLPREMAKIRSEQDRSA